MDIHLITLIVNEIKNKTCQLKAVDKLMNDMKPCNQKLLVKNTIMKNHKKDVLEIFGTSLKYYLSNVIDILEHLVLDEYKISLKEYFIYDILENAIKSNNNAHVKQLLPNDHILINDMIFLALKHNNMDIMEWVIRQPWYEPDHIFSINTSLENIKDHSRLLDLLPIINSPSLNSNLLLHAAKYNNFELLKVLIGDVDIQNINMDQKRALNLAIYYATSRGHFDILRLIHRKMPHFRNDLIDLACLNKEINIIVWLLQNGYKFTDYAIINAASIGSYKIVSYLLDIITRHGDTYGIHLDTLINGGKTMTAAIQSGNVKLVKYLYELGFEIEKDFYMNMVVENGDLEMFRFLYENKVKYEYCKNYEDIMASKGHVYMIKYVKDYIMIGLDKYKISRILKHAIRHCKINVIEYVKSMGFSIIELLGIEKIKKEILLAIKLAHKSKDIVKYFSNQEELFAISHIREAAYLSRFDIVKIIFNNGKFMNKIYDSYMFKMVDNKKKKEFFIWAMHENYEDIFSIFGVTYITDLFFTRHDKHRIALYLTRNKNNSIFPMEDIDFYNAIITFAITKCNNLGLIEWVIKHDPNFDMYAFVDFGILMFEAIESLVIVKFICHHISIHKPNFDFDELYKKARRNYTKSYLEKNYIHK